MTASQISLVGPLELCKRRLVSLTESGSIGKTNTIPFGLSSAGFGPLKQACVPVWWVCGGSGREIRCAARVAVVAVGVLDPRGRGAATGGRWRRAGWYGDDGSGTRGWRLKAGSAPRAQGGGARERLPMEPRMRTMASGSRIVAMGSRVPRPQFGQVRMSMS
jgi:hypothetical protein